MSAARVRMGLLCGMSVLIAVWLFVSADDAAAQRRFNVPDGTQAAIDAAVSTNANAITAINGRLDQIAYIANDARDEVRSLRNALWALAAALLLSFLTQVAQIKRDRSRP